MWKKRILSLTLLVLCAVLLTACQPQDQEIYSDTPPTATPTYAPIPEQQETGLIPDLTELYGGGSTIDFDDPQYNPEAEEGGQEEEIPINISQTPTPTPAPTVNSAFAGATPVPIDPINKPTPTPVPKIEFKDSDYVTYDAAALHLTFQGPAGWRLEGPTSWEPGGDSMDTYTLTNEGTELDYAARIRIRVINVNSQYSRSDLDKEVKAVRDSIRNELGFSRFDNYDVASYNFIKIRDEKSTAEAPKYKFVDNKGRYTRFKGTLKENGAKVGGRVIVNCYNKALYILAVTYPGGDLQETFEDVYRKVRDTTILNP